MTKEERLQRDIARLAEMRSHEDELRSQGYRFVAGIDEVGRGPLAGPVYAACVILPEDFDVLGIYDSKKLSAKKREELSEIIKERAVACALGVADNHEIDEINILEATKKAMKRAVAEARRQLADKGLLNEDAEDYERDILLIDALKLDIPMPQEAIVKGDEKSLSIAAASIVAKVARDKHMEELDLKYPGYEFASNKGYGTAAHYEGLRELGISEVHRRSFLKKFEENPSTGHKETKLAKKVYAVRKGKTPGLYMTWEDCKAQVDGFAGAEYKGFADPQDAMEYLGLSGGAGAAGAGGRDSEEAKLPPGVRAYVDGSYDSASGRFSCGVVILITDESGNTETTELKSAFDDAGAAAQRNVAGEVMGAKTAIDYCLANDIREITIYHDYEGVGKWADDLWKANNSLTQAYKAYVADARKGGMIIKFEKVKAHAGNRYNEQADRLAKEALK